MGKLNVAPREARKFVFASKLSRDQTCYSQFHRLQVLGDSGLRNGLAKKSTATTILAVACHFPGSDGSLIDDNFGQSVLEPRIKLRKNR
jgi:hypothetical protein